MRNPIQIKDRWQNIESYRMVSAYLSDHELSVVDGGKLGEVESRIADLFGRKYCVSFCNGTAAIHAASYALFGCGSVVNVPKYSYFGAVNALLENRIHVRLQDVDHESLLFDLEEDSHVAGCGNLMLTTVWGAGYSLEQISSYRERHPCAKVLMDNSHGYGTSYMGKSIAASEMIDICCFSMGRGKFIDAGEFGVALTNDAELAARMMLLGHPNRISSNALFQNIPSPKNAIGNKYRPHLAALLLAEAQLDRLERKMWLNKRTCSRLEARLTQFPGVCPQKQSDGVERCYWKIPVRLDASSGVDPVRLRARLKKDGFPLMDDYQYSDFESQSIWMNDRYGGLAYWDSSIPCDGYEDWFLLPGYVDIPENDQDMLVEVFFDALMDLR